MTSLTPIGMDLVPGLREGVLAHAEPCERYEGRAIEAALGAAKTYECIWAAAYRGRPCVLRVPRP